MARFNRPPSEIALAPQQRISFLAKPPKASPISSLAPSTSTTGRIVKLVGECLNQEQAKVAEAEGKILVRNNG